ncbi:MAG: hypothetical protein O2985_09105 [Proteobacteria bacterium]|nr:hypothetical protein [Pseudomonadota bacterium]
MEYWLRRHAAKANPLKSAKSPATAPTNNRYRCWDWTAPADFLYRLSRFPEEYCRGAGDIQGIGKMGKIGAILLVLIGALAGCGEDINPIHGSWQGTITQDQIHGLQVPEAADSSRVIMEFTEHTTTINGKILKTEHKTNDGAYFFNEIGTDRSMVVRVKEPDRIEVRLPDHFKREIISLLLTRIPPQP